MPTTITDVVAFDVRFPTSKALDGSDAMNPDPDYSAAYAVLRTDHPLGADSLTLLPQSQAPDDHYEEVRVHFSKQETVE